MSQNPILDEPEDLPVPDELTTLKLRADQMGLSYHPSIKLEKLREKVAAHIAGESTEDAPTPVAVSPGKETEAQRNFRLRREANELIRVRVSCMNPHKKDIDGEIFTTGNSIVGTIKKYVPYNNEEGWHIPRMIYEQLLQRECQVFVPVRDNRGNTTRKAKLIREFAIEVLPPLTLEELKALAQRQAMADGTAA